MKVKLVYFPETNTDLTFISVCSRGEILAHIYSDMSKDFAKGFFVNFLEKKLTKVIRDCFINHGFISGVTKKLYTGYYTSEIVLEV